MKISQTMKIIILLPVIGARYLLLLLGSRICYNTPREDWILHTSRNLRVISLLTPRTRRTVKLEK